MNDQHNNASSFYSKGHKNLDFNNLSHTNTNKITIFYKSIDILIHLEVND